MIIKNAGIPLYLQVKSYILDKIKNGELKPGDKIPTERQLAKELGLSRNTVSEAYRELLKEDIIEACQGRGTFIKKTDAQDGVSRMDKALRIIDEAIAKFIDLGFTVNEFAVLASIRARQKVDTVIKLRVALVDCTPEFLDVYCEQFLKYKLQIEKVTLQELADGRITKHFLNACDYVVTTAQHQYDVKKYVYNQDKLVIVSTMPSMESAICLARITENEKVGIVCETELFVKKVEEFVSRIAGRSLSYVVCCSKTREDIRQFIQNVDCVIVSKSREGAVRQLAEAHHNIICFYYEIDQGSLNHLRSKLIKH